MARHKATTFFLRNLHNQAKKLKQKVIRLRPYQAELDRMLTLDKSFISICWARRLGKDYVVFAYVIRQCVKNANYRVAYFFPTVNQGKRAIFEGITLDNKPWLEELVHTDNLLLPKTSQKLYHSDNTIRFKNGSIIQILGADTASNKVGTNENLIVFSEAAHMDKFELLMNRMMPSVNLIGGRIVAISTPKYGSYFNEFLQDNKSKRWKTSIVTAKDAELDPGIKVYTDEELEMYRSDMSNEEFQQEYMCNLDIPNTTSILGRSLEDKLMVSKREFKSGLHISFDLGANRDYTVLTFARYTEDGKLTVVHHLGMNGVGIKHYDTYIRQYCIKNKINRSSVRLYLPHDSKSSQRGWNANTNTYQQLKAEGWSCNLVRKTDVVTGLNVMKSAIENKKIAFLNDHNVMAFIKKLKAYEYKKDTTGKNTFIPNHGRAGDAASNFADSLRYLCLHFFNKKETMENFEPIVNNNKSVFD